MPSPPPNPAPRNMNEMDYLVESVPNLVHPSTANAARPQNPWLAILFPLLISIGAGLLCLWAAGFTLGLFLGGLVIIALITPPLVAGETTWLGRGLAWGGAVHGVAAVWCYATLQADADLALWAACYLVLAAFAAACAALVTLLRRVRVGPTVAAALVTVLALAWLTWPVWLSPVLPGPHGDRLTAWLVPANPLFATNAVLREPMGLWAEHPIAYNISILTEVNYALPEGVGWSLIVHGLIATVCVVGSLKRRT